MDSYSWRGVMLAAYAVSGFICFPQVSFAQNAIAPDKTLPVNTVINFNGANKTYTITGGTQVGANQFHSFQDLSVPTVNTAHFDNALTTANVIGRVTGSNISNIDGTLKTNGSTNLYLINPNGIIFGANAKLDIGGSFSASTANSFKFSDGSEFSATNPQAPSLLQVTMPLGLQYGKSSPAPITNAGNLSVGKDLVLSGGSVTSTGSLSAPKGNLRLEAIAGDVTATQLQAGRALQVMSVGNVTIDAIAITGNGTNNDNNSKVPLSDGSFLAVDVATRPIVDIRAGVLPSAFFSAPAVAANTLIGANISIGSITFDDTLKTANGLIFLTNQFAQNSNLVGDISVGKISTYNFEGNAGSVAIDSKGGINVAAPIYAYSDNANGGAVNLLANGDITVAGIYTISNSYDYSIGGNISLLSRNGNIDATQGDILAYSSNFAAGKVTLNSGKDVSIGNITISAASGYLGSANDIAIDAGSVSISSSILDAGAYGYGNAGNITISASDVVSFDGAIASTEVAVTGVGNAGKIAVNANTVSILNNSALSSSTLGQGNAGNVTIQSNGKVSFDFFSSVLSDVGATGVGKGGDVSIDAGSLSVAIFSKLSSSTVGQGNAGNVNIKVEGLASFDLFSLALSDVGSQLDPSGIGNSGIVNIKAGNLSVTRDSNLSSSNFGQGNAGDVNIKTFESALLGSGSFIATENHSKVGNAGNITIDAGSLSVKDSSFLSSVVYGQGNAGNIDIKASDVVSVVKASSIYTNAATTGTVSNAGNITIDAGSVFITDSAKLSSGISGQGNAGNIDIKASGQISFARQSLVSSSVGLNTVGNGGNVTINASSVSITDGSILSTGTSGRGNAGNIDIQSIGKVTFASESKAFTTVGDKAVGNSGSVTINANSVEVIDGAALQSDTFGKGNAGNISIKASDQVSFDRKGLASTGVNGTKAIGNAGNVTIDAKSVTVNDAGLSSSTFGHGNSGNINITATEKVLFANDGNAFIAVGFRAVGNAGDVNVSAPSIFVMARSKLSSSTLGQGNAGSVTIAATDKISFVNGSASSAVLVSAIGKAGTVTLKAPSISLEKMSALTSSTDGQGNAGDIIIKATDAVVFNASVASSTVNPDAIGDGGSIKIEAPSVFVTDGFGLTSTTFGKGNAGNITIAADSIVLNSVGIFANTNSNHFKGGNIEISSQTLEILNGATISTSTSSSGNAGLINILLTRSLNLDGQNTLISAQTTETSSGKGGSIFIDPPLISITNGAGISVNSLGTGNGGNTDIFASKFTFANNAFISATTASGEGGNINLQIADIFFPRNQSSINATAGNNGNGGNINLSALFLVSIPSENNDIFANASFGKGGNINITTQGIFGLASRSSQTTLSDITASSEFGVQGTISINTPGVDPSKGLNNLPVNVSDPSRLVKERCIADRRGSEFIITGKGGVPANPSDHPTDTGVFDNFGASPDRHQTTNLTSSPTAQPTTTPDAIVEATNWIVNAQNQVVLVAGKTPAQPNILCPR